MSVGFVGLGIMGEGMARRLLTVGGRNLVVWNRSSAKAEALKEEHAEKVKVVETPAAVVAECSLVYCMLSTPDAVRSVYEMEGGVLAGVSTGKCIVDCATLAVEDMERLSKQVLERGGRFLEAPVSGSKGPAATGQLIFLAGGDEALFQEAGADLDAMGKAKFYFGPVGQGTRMKLVVNMIMGSMMCAFGEGLSLAEATGLDPSKLLEVLDLGAMANPMFKLKGPKMLASDHAPNFPLQHAEKDVRLAVAMGSAAGLELPVASTADETMKRAMDSGLGEQDFSAVVEAQKKQKSS
mmetsp:Transcript_91895/g.259575  ORF Transcript_91895/g.259575 Transcript_91895/m.259575 type:complete len:295 (-) Transcript_91895:104-988(-)